MKCNNHHSSSAGICASCLRQRLLIIIAAQEESAQLNDFNEEDDEEEEISDVNHPVPIFPRSVSPYIHRRKSDIRQQDNIDTFNSLQNKKFFSTPQIGHAGEIIVDDNYSRGEKKRSRKFWMFRNFFRSKSEIIVTDSHPKESIETSTATTVPPRRSLFSSVLPRRKKLRSYSIDESAISDHRNHRNHGFDDEDDVKNCHVETSGCNTEELQNMPRRTPGRGGGGRRRHLSRNVSEIVFCLSPLVRASPNRIWNQKGGLPPEMGGAGEGRVPVKPRYSVTASSFCKNRSRKLADFGRRKH